MISDYKASVLGAKFLSNHKHPKLAERVDNADYCLDEVFDQLLKSRGKSYILDLYQKLPKQLKEYVICTLLSENGGLRTTLHNIDSEFNRGPVPIKDFTNKQFKKFKEKCNKVIVQFLKGEHNVDTSN